MNTPDAEAVPSSNNSATSLSPQPPDVESKLEIRGVGSNAPITRLPKEVLNRIIRGMIAADIYGVALPFDIAWKDFRVRADLASCSRVCRQWRQIALPYLFHYFNLGFLRGESWTHDALEDRSDDEIHLFTFLSKAPTIAPLIHELFVVSSVLPLSAISCMLTLLPKLRSVQIINTSVIGYDKCVDRGKTFHINSVDYTAHEQNDRSDNYVVTVLELLTLFSEIGTLYLADVGVSDDFGDEEDEEERHEYVDHSSRIANALEQIVNQGLVIRGIRLHHSEYMRFHRDVICSHPDILLHVVCLELAGVIFPDTYDDIISLLSILRPRLRELTICFQSSVEISYYTEGRLRMIPTWREDIYVLLREQLISCPSLHALRLSMCSTIEFGRTEDTERRSAAEFALADWQFLVRLLGSAVSSTKLTHISLCFWQKVYILAGRLEYTSRDFNFHELPWFMLRDVCRGHRDLKSIAISFAEHVHDNHERVGVQCIREQMKEFKEAIALGESGEFDTCREKTCPWYKP